MIYNVFAYVLVVIFNWNMYKQIEIIMKTNEEKGKVVK